MPRAAFDVLIRSVRTLFLFSAYPWIWAPCLFSGLALFATAQRAPQIEGSVVPTAVSLEQGFAFITPVSKELHFPFHIQGAAMSTKATGPLVLFEDDFPLGPSDALHEDIRNKGGGLYSHWDGHLYFSSSDGSDPRSNARVYSYRVQSALRPIPHLAALLLTTFAVIGLAAYGARQRPLSTTVAQTGDRERHIVRVGGALVVLGVAGLVALRFVAATSAPQEGTLDVGVIKHAGSLGYVAPIKVDSRWPLRPAARDSAVPSSVLTIAEDGKPLGRYETDPRELRNKGGSRYTFYGDRLVFSTLDGTDPRTNGRTYTWKLQQEVHPAPWVSLLAIVAAGFVLVLKVFGLPALFWITGKSVVRVGAPALGRTSIVQAFLVLLACTVAVYLVTFRWTHGQSSLLGFMGYLPMSDAEGYFWCGVWSGGFDMSARPQFPWEWCARRIFYPTVLASYFGLSGWRPQLVLLLQAAVVGCAISVFALIAARYIGRMAALVAAFMLFVVAYELAIGNFMTESFGVPLGLFALTLLLAYAGGQRHTAVLYAGLALFSIAMFGRMGALFTLPLLGLWACVEVFRSVARHKIILCLGAFVAVAAGPILQVLLVLLLGGDPANSGANYSTVLYGLSTGSRDWSQAHRDFEQFFHPSEAVGFAKVQAAALANIRDNPAVFLNSLFQNVQAFATSAFTIGSLTYVNSWLTALWVIGLVWCVGHARRPIAALLLAVSVGELISVPLVFIGASDHRVLAVSLGARVLLVGVGLTWLMSILVAALIRVLGSSDRQQRNTGAALTVDFNTRLALGAGTLLAILAVLPATPVRHLFALPSVSGAGCPMNQREVVARVGRESLALVIGSPLNPVNERVLGVLWAQVEADPGRSPGAWWAQRLPNLQQGTMFIYAVQLMPNAREQLIPLVFDGELPGSSATPLSFCYEPKPTSIELGGVIFHRARSVRAVPMS